jgi:D-cysteine desulfhydrase family pyridoxal phosphate-dependent enzyme
MAPNRRGFLSRTLAAALAPALLPHHAPASGSPAADNAGALERFRALPRLGLATRGTPVEKCDRLRQALPGAPHLYVKRDDCQGYLVGGNKLRKLDYVMADAARHKATTVVTVGGTTSNHARVTAMVAARLGLKCHLVLNGKAAATPTGNLRIDRLVGATVHLVETRAQRNVVMDELARDLGNKGERVYKVPLGASNEVGSFGFVAALEEVRRQQEELGVRFDAIVFSSSSGGTQAGLEVGKRLLNWPRLQILGVSPDDAGDAVRGYVLKAANPMLALLGLPAVRDRAELVVDDRQVGGGYRVPTEASKEAEALFVRTEGLLLDPVYTAKAAAGLIDYCRARRFGPDDHVLFWHTGGLVALFE